MRSLHTWILVPATLVLLPTTLMDGDGTSANHNLVVVRGGSAAFIADGQRFPPSEYSLLAGDMMDLAGSHLDGKVLLNRFRQADGSEELRIYFSVHDKTPFGGDQIDIYIDRLHNHGASGTVLAALEDSVIRISRADCSGVTCVFTVLGRTGTGLFGGVGRPFTPTTAQVVAVSAGEYVGSPPPFNTGWTGELVVRPVDFGWASFPPLLGVMVLASSADANDIGDGTGLGTPANARWPAIGGVSANAPLTWGHLKLRYPIEYAISLDNSGSMLATDGTPDTRWIRAKRAANLFVATLGLFKDDLINDFIFVSQYSWSCSNDADAGNTTGALSGVSASAQPIPAPSSSGSFLAGNTTSPAGNNCTPIKTGLDYSLFTQLNVGVPTPKRDRIVLLLSDGFHNTPNATVPVFNNDPASFYTPPEKQLVAVRTVALGPDGSAGTDLLHDLSVAFAGGLTEEAKYNQTNNFHELLTAYIEALQAPLAINRVDDAAPPPDPHGSFSPGSQSGDKLVFIGVWDNPALASTLTVQRNSDAGIAGPIANATIGYAAVTVTSPTPGGTWTFLSASGGTMPDQRFVLIDPGVAGRVLIPQHPYGVGDPITLQFALTERGQPITGAAATVEVFRPGEGLGTFLSVIQDDCSQGSPVLPPDSGRTMPRVPQVATQPATTLAAAQQVRGEPLPGRYALAAAWFAHCKKPALLRDTLPGVRLYDDGTHGDAAPADGIYSLTYTGATLEGSYTFRFHAEGKTTDSVTFTRTRTVSQYFAVWPAVTATAVTLTSGGVVGAVSTVLVSFLPRDRFGNYLGPGYAPSFTVTTNGGSLVGAVQDLGNGYYRQVVRYATRGGAPIIVVGLPGTNFTKAIDVSGRAPFPRLPGWLCLVLIVLLLLLLLWAWRRKKTA